DALCDFGRSQAPGAGDHARCADLDPADDIAIGLDGGQNPVDVDRLGAAEFGNPVAGHQPDRPDIEEGPDGFGAGVDDVFAQAVEIGLAGRPGIGHGGHAAFAPGAAG